MGKENSLRADAQLNLTTVLEIILMTTTTKQYFYGSGAMWLGGHACSTLTSVFVEEM